MALNHESERLTYIPYFCLTNQSTTLLSPFVRAIPGSVFREASFAQGLGIALAVFGLRVDHLAVGISLHRAVGRQLQRGCDGGLCLVDLTERRVAGRKTGLGLFRYPRQSP